MPWWTGFPGSAELGSVYVQAAEAARGRHDELATEMAADLVAAGMDAAAESPLGDAATEILAAAGPDTDLIALGTHGRTGLSRLLLGSVARNVVQHAACWVLVAGAKAGAGRA